MTEKQLDKLIPGFKQVPPIEGYVCMTSVGNFFITTNVDKQLTGKRLIYPIGKPVSIESIKFTKSSKIISKNKGFALAAGYQNHAAGRGNL